MPLICGLLLGGGVLLGSYMDRPGFSGDGFFDASDREKKLAFGKIRSVMRYVEKNYVDSIDPELLTDRTLEAMLHTLDPHSGYYTAEEIKAMNEPLEGNFEGVGIEYNFLRDTLVVLAVIPGGPSEQAGLLPGDRIIKADGASLTGKAANDKFAKSKLRGPKNTQVKVTVFRHGSKDPFALIITRGNIPIVSVESFYMLNPETGYLKLVRFSETSHKEFTAAVDSLIKQGMKKLVFDLRANGGGLLEQAVLIADEFLPAGKLIVYTKGRHEGKKTEKATTRGKLETIPLALLVDENSASASEIVAGAIQDNDRGQVIGRRTFGKGLVQTEEVLSDGSAFRLTIARYYTPTGRCIQKPYDKGIEAYADEENVRYLHGELLNQDSIHFPDSLKFKTPGGRTVYGGGGIMPDVFVPLDTTGRSGYMASLISRNNITIWSLDYTRRHKSELLRNTLSEFVEKFMVTEQMIAELAAVGGRKNGKQNHLPEAQTILRRAMKAAIARNLWGDKGYYQAINQNDPVIKTAIAALK